MLMPFERFISFTLTTILLVATLQPTLCRPWIAHTEENSILNDLLAESSGEELDLSDSSSEESNWSHNFSDSSTNNYSDPKFFDLSYESTGKDGLIYPKYAPEDDTEESISDNRKGFKANFKDFESLANPDQAGLNELANLHRVCSDIVPLAECGQRNETECETQEDCKNETMVCCFDGCTNTCVYNGPAPVIDWLEEPKKTSKAKYFFLNDESNEEMVCFANSMPGEVDMLCPEDYWCMITSGGDLENDIPARGICKHDSERPAFLQSVHVE